MTNVISFNPQKLFHRGPARFGALATTFASRRRLKDDVYWLKENAEFLNILQSARFDVTSDVLRPYQEFYTSAFDKLIFFPQYYRFLLGIVLDLEDIGMGQTIGKDMCDHVAMNHLVEAEMSDLQRGEAMRLLSRRNVTVPDARDLQARLTKFARHSATFAVPNRKAAYELTHILFYLSDYGQKDPRLGSDVRQSLMFTGFIALLEQNIDLLAEVCISLRFGGWEVPADWDAEIAAHLNSFQIAPGQTGHADEYHCYLMANWSLALKGDAAFDDTYDAGAVGFFASDVPIGALNAVSASLLEMGESRHKDWSGMRSDLLSRLPQEAASHLDYVSTTGSEFDAFFANFSRASSLPGISLKPDANTIMSIVS